MTTERLRYSVSMLEPWTHYFQVQIVVPDSVNPGSRLDLVMPVWTPGSYLVREFPRNVLDLKARRTNSGDELDVRKVSKNTWTVDTEGRHDDLVVEYRVYAHEHTVDTSFLDSDHAVINGASVFMAVRGLEHHPIALMVVPYAEWKKISTGLEEHEEGRKEDGWTFLVPNFDVLVDSPIETGNQDVRTFSAGGVKYEICIFGLESKSDQDSLERDLKKIVESTVPIFEDVPFSRYAFIIDFQAGPGGGLEHLDSTYCMASRLRLRPPEEYRLLLSLFSHEFFHAWNVKRMRPVGLGPFNYSSETYSRSLWVAEGITSYYDDLVLRRAEIYSVGEYLDAFCSNIDQMDSLPGSAWQSAEESSFDAWIKHYRQDENSPNVVSSYYVQGAVVGWMIDMAIRVNTRSGRNLDDVLRKVYQHTYKKQDRGYTEEEFENACNEIAGGDLSSSIFDRRVRGREKVEYNLYLSYAGLRLGPKTKQLQDDERGFLGVKLKSDGGRILVLSRLSGSPAESSGLSAGDEIIGADGTRMDQSALSYYLSNRVPGDRVQLLIAREGRLKEVGSNLSSRPVFEHRIYKIDTATPEQKDLFAKWLLSDWEAEIVYPDIAPSPVKRQFFDYI